MRLNTKQNSRSMDQRPNLFSWSKVQESNGHHPALARAGDHGLVTWINFTGTPASIAIGSFKDQLLHVLLVDSIWTPCGLQAELKLEFIRARCILNSLGCQQWNSRHVITDMMVRHSQSTWQQCPVTSTSQPRLYNVYFGDKFIHEIKTEGLLRLSVLKSLSLRVSSLHCLNARIKTLNSFMSVLRVFLFN